MHFLKAFQFFHLFSLFLDKRVKQPGMYVHASIIKTLDRRAPLNQNGSLFFDGSAADILPGCASNVRDAEDSMKIDKEAAAAVRDLDSPIYP